MSFTTDQEMRDLLIRLDTKVDAINSKLDAIERRTDGHENRLTILEREVLTIQTTATSNQNWLKALWAVCGSGVLAFIAKLSNLI